MTELLDSAELRKQTREKHKAEERARTTLQTTIEYGQVSEYQTAYEVRQNQNTARALAYCKHCKKWQHILPLMICKVCHGPIDENRIFVPRQKIRW